MVGKECVLYLKQCNTYFSYKLGYPDTNELTYKLFAPKRTIYSILGQFERIWSFLGLILKIANILRLLLYLSLSDNLDILGCPGCCIV